MSTTTTETHEPSAPAIQPPRSLGVRDGHVAAPAGEPLRSSATAPSGPAKPRRNPIPLVVAASILLVLTGFGIRQWAFARVHVSTDNAQVEGDIIPVLPRVAGFVAEVRVRENQRVRVGETLIVLDDRDLKPLRASQ